MATGMLHRLNVWKGTSLACCSRTILTIGLSSEKVQVIRVA